MIVFLQRNNSKCVLFVRHKNIESLKVRFWYFKYCFKFFFGAKISKLNGWVIFKFKKIINAHFNTVQKLSQEQHIMVNDVLNVKAITQKKIRNVVKYYPYVY